jgi:molybdenum cofactor guanylyltransferase
VSRPIAGVILAGGLARRMGGGDKALVPVAGRPMLDRVIERLAPQVDRLVINANGDPSRFAPYRLPVVADTVPGFAGPLAGILAGMRWAEMNLPEAKALVSVAGDTPFFPADLVARLTDAGGDGGIALAASPDGVHPVFGLWPLDLADPLQEFLHSGQGGKILAFADRHSRRDVAFGSVHLAGGPVFDPFFNINSPAEAAEAEAIAAAFDREHA